MLEYFKVIKPFSGSMMMVQFIVVHSSLFVFALSVFMKEGRARTVVFWSLILFYSAVAIKTTGVLGAGQFWLLTYCTYYGYVFRQKKTGEKIPLALRWIIGLFLFIVVIGFSGVSSNVDNWDGDTNLALPAAIYFGALGSLELSGIHEIDWPAKIKKLLEKVNGVEKT